MPAIYIHLTEHHPPIDVSVNGRALSKFQDELEALAKRRGVPSLMDFFSIDPMEVWEMIAEEGDEPPTELPWHEEWFAAQDGLITVHSLLQYLDENPEESAALDGVADDLRDFERILTEADKRGVRWHTVVDS